jgi:hypothetical protein
MINTEDARIAADAGSITAASATVEERRFSAASGSGMIGALAPEVRNN